MLGEPVCEKYTSNAQVPVSAGRCPPWGWHGFLPAPVVSVQDSTRLCVPASPLPSLPASLLPSLDFFSCQEHTEFLTSHCMPYDTTNSNQPY